MPIYEYACRSCGAAFERRLKYEERLTAQTCPSCGHEGAVLRISAPALVGGGAASESGTGVCPTSGEPCACGHGVRH